MWLVNVSVMLAVVQWASSAGGSPRLPTRTTPPLVCAWAAVVRAASPNRTAMLAVKSRRSKPDRAIPPPPSGEYVRTGAVTLPRRGSLVNVPVRAVVGPLLAWPWGKLRARRGASGPAARGVRGCTLRVAGPLATWPFELSSAAARRGLSQYGEANCPRAGKNSAAPGGLSASPARRMDPGMCLRNGDRGAVAVGGNREGAGAARRIGVGTRPGR